MEQQKASYEKGIRKQISLLQEIFFSSTALKMIFYIKDFFTKFDQTRRKLRIWSHLLKKSVMEKHGRFMERNGMERPWPTNFLRRKKQKGNKRKKRVSKQKLLKGWRRSKYYCFSNSRASRIQIFPYFLNIVLPGREHLLL